MCRSVCWILTILLVVLNHIRSTNSLLSPASSGLSVVSSVSVPLSEFLPERRIIIDWCFTVSYDLPSQLSSFYNIPIWPGFANLKTKRDLPHNQTQLNMYSKYGYNPLAHIHPKDFSAGELYEAMEDMLTSYGFHETCVLRSVCELARHPFGNNQHHLASDLLTFILSPSQHEGFLESEHVYRQAYEQAELNGFLGKDCALLYRHCNQDILSVITKVIF